MDDLGAEPRRRILIIADRYLPEISAASTRLHAHAKRWVQAGHDVEVLTCVPNFPAGKIFAGYKNKRIQHENVDGVRINRIWSFMAPNSGRIRRAADYLSFPLSSILNTRQMQTPDVILASSPPITVALSALWLSWRYGCPWVFEVRDLWPASIRAVGAARGPIVDLIEHFELSLYRSAAATLVLTDAFFDDITNRGIPGEKLSVVTNGVDLEPFRHAPSQLAARKLLNVPNGKTIVGFIGTVGLAQGAGTFALAASELSSRTDIHFICWGEGADRPKVERIATDLKLKNIEFRDFLPQDKIPAMLSSIDIATVLLKDDPVFETVIPSKIFEILAAGKAIAACVRGEARRLIERSGGGDCVDPEDHKALAVLIENYANDESKRELFSRRGLEFISHNYSRDALATQALNVLVSVCKGRATNSGVRS